MNKASVVKFLSKKQNRRKLFLTGCLLTGILGFSLYFAGGGSLSATASVPPVLRLHVIADSDSEYDQALKLEVRDEIIGVLREKLATAQSLEEAEAIVEDNLDEIENIACEYLQGKADYSAHVELGMAEFPTKSYGDMVFPAGEYHALRVILGSGEGKNWWCVLFPSLCYVDAVGDIDDAMAVSTGKSAFKIKWKIIELLRGEE